MSLRSWMNFLPIDMNICLYDNLMNVNEDLIHVFTLYSFWFSYHLDYEFKNVSNYIGKLLYHPSTTYSYHVLNFFSNQPFRLCYFNLNIVCKIITFFQNCQKWYLLFLITITWWKVEDIDKADALNWLKSLY